MQEDDKLIESFMEHTFDRELENFDSVEFFINTKCNLSCKYCYLNKFPEGLYPAQHQDSEQILENTKKAIDWLPDTYCRLELFSGEPLIQNLSYEMLDVILESDEMNPREILIPTNGTFIKSDKFRQKLEHYLERSREVGCPIFPSLSVDGKFCEANRPTQTGSVPFSDEDYENLFAFAKKWNCGWHPMVYSERIEHWKDNFLWFQQMMKKYDIPYKNIYLLEVRNREWTTKQMNELYKFLRFLVHWTFDFHNRDVQQLIDFIFDRGFNILSNPFSTIGRGLGCSIQSTSTLRMGDLAIVPCHRTSYSPFILGYLTEDGIKAENPELFIRTFTLEGNSMPYCENCAIKELCQKQCLGSQFEVTGDLFTPIPTVCKMEHFKIKGIVDGLKDVRAYESLVRRVRSEKTRALRNLEDSS